MSHRHRKRFVQAQAEGRGEWGGLDRMLPNITNDKGKKKKNVNGRREANWIQNSFATFIIVARSKQDPTSVTD